ncbi:hypothetical protein GCM10022280_06150 [Sphingomonas swuensis]|uniref:Beta-lactamase-related domain-containing protein n=1 Tax=Sphingomonas swuensis TaxID=977800 RepID=A0ABP7SG91_9SPHN
MRVVVAGLMVAVAGKAAAVPAGFANTAGRIIAADAPANGPGVSAVVSENGRIVWKGASGRADSAGAPLKADSLFRYASISKQFTAALILKLAEEGKLSLDDTLGKLLPGETPPAWHPVTVRQLLNHTSGIPSYTGKPSFMAEASTARAISTQGLIDVTRDDPLDFAPGTEFRYNNTGYVLLSAIAEKLTGKPWYAALRERITGPLGLNSIRCGCEPGPAVVEGFGAEGRPAQRIDMSVPSGAGALVGSAADLARWGAALHGGKVLKPASYQAMITPIPPKGVSMAYGFGLTRGEVRGVPTIGHNGGIFGFNTESLYSPDKKIFVAVLANSDSREPGADTTARRLLAAAAGVAFPELRAQPLDLKAAEPFFGVYRDARTERRFYAKDGKLFTQRTGADPLEVYAAGGGRYFYGPSSLTYFEVGRDGAGKPRLTFHPEGQVTGIEAAWTGAASGPAAAAAVVPVAQLDLLAGEYATGPAVMTIARNGEKLTGQLTGQSPIGLEAIGPREFRTVGVDARLTFVEEGGRIVRVVLNQNGRTIPFERR